MSSKFLLSAVSISLLSLFTSAQAQFNSVEQKASYAIGVDLAQNLRSQGIELDVNTFLQGLEDALKQQKLKLTNEQMAEAIETFSRSLEEKKQAKLQAAAKINSQRGKEFLAKNKSKVGIISLESGLQYRVIEQGKGNTATENDVIIAHYRGTLIDGTEFDSSYNRGTPIEFKLNNVIPGWQEALKLMSPGAKWEIFVPAELAYGERGAGNVIGPNETLIFEIHFIALGTK